MIRLSIATPDDMARLGGRIAVQLRAGDIVALTGELGAGKTTLARGLGEALGVRGTVTSPTFVLARTHPRDGAAPLVHVDAYRLANAAELDDLDIDFPGSIVVVEWAEGMLDGISDSMLEISIVRPTGARTAPDHGEPDHGEPDHDEPDHDEPDHGIEAREVTITPIGPRWAEHPFL